MARKVRCVVVTPERTELEDSADFVALPLHDGEIGVSPGRAPVVGRMGPGELRLQDADQEPRRYFVDGGFVQIRDDVVTLLTPRATPADKLTVDAIEKDLALVSAEVPTSDVQLDAKADRLERLRARLRLARRKKR